MLCTTWNRKEREKRKRQNSLPALAPNGNDMLAKNSHFSLEALPGSGLSPHNGSCLYNLTTTRLLLHWPRASSSSMCKKHLLHKGDEAECGALISSPRPFKLPIWCWNERQANGFKCMTAVHYCVPNENGLFITAPASSTKRKCLLNKWWQLNRIQS